MAPLVTAVVATYRPERFLKDALASALAQSLGDLEVIVADDGNDPAVRELVESFGDSRLAYRGNAERLGCARNHWAAFAAARGKYLSILNHDDLWRSTFLERLTEPLERDPQLVLAFCDHDIVDPAGATMVDATDQASAYWGRAALAAGSHQPFHPLVVQQTIPIAMGSVFRRDAVDAGALPDVGPAYDLWLGYELARGGLGCWYLPNRLSAWRQHPAQLTQTRSRAWASGTVACWKAMGADPAFTASASHIPAKLSAAAVEATRRALDDRDWKAARQSALTAVAARPTNWRAWAALGMAHLPAGWGAH